VALMADTGFAFAPQWRVRPLVTAGAGVARNSVGHVTFAFPSIGEDAVTITRGGASTSFAWTAGAGMSFAMTPNLSLDLTWRTTDLGDVETDAGTATIVRPTRRLEIEIAGTRMALKTSGIAATIRWRR
jgi:opacity protein-like surface antigen